ncbi:STAS domain-containing protein [Rhizobium sp. TH2]|uniref:STAS domain-containing protein n=1 Tax=Rhizobium sp. TH2 TaxID=2775403 RepID=UPI0021584D99|nr:STAS domain-containing protein [Rhizobium sp. TH2]UVC06939.1 STAS domain-containing protein [Rhizobium sp. TH2]
MTFSFPETVNIRTIGDLKEEIIAKISSVDLIELDLGKCSDIDLSALQLIESVRIYAASTGKQMKLSTPANAAVASTLTRAGFTERMTPEDRLFWLHKED